MIKTHSLPLMPRLYDATVRGEKTEATLAMVPQPPRLCAPPSPWCDDWCIAGHEYRSPYGGPGDLLHVGEALERMGDHAIYQRGHEPVLLDGRPAPWRKANGEPWKARVLPSISCPLIYRRLWLRVEVVVVERLQAITTAGLQAEGARLPVDDQGRLLYRLGTGQSHDGPQLLSDWTIDDYWRHEFAALWDSINVKRGYSWTSNPWVWRVRYSIASTTGDPR